MQFISATLARKKRLRFISPHYFEGNYVDSFTKTTFKLSVHCIGFVPQEAEDLLLYIDLQNHSLAQKCRYSSLSTIEIHTK